MLPCIETLETAGDCYTEARATWPRKRVCWPWRITSATILLCSDIAHDGRWWWSPLTYWLKPCRRQYAALHTVAIWTFTFHKKSGFVMVILKANFKPAHKPVSWTFWSENSDLLYPFSFYFRQELSNPLLFAHCCCYFNALTYLSCNLIQKCDSNISSC